MCQNSVSYFLIDVAAFKIGFKHAFAVRFRVVFIQMGKGKVCLDRSR